MIENTKEEIRKAIKEMVSGYEKIPSHAMMGPATNHDIYSVLLLLLALVEESFRDSSN
jgi:hypothetical protein